MFRYRQSSDEPAARPSPVVASYCAHMVFWVGVVASRTPSHIGLGCGCGGRQRLSPVGGCAKGTW